MKGFVLRLLRLLNVELASPESTSAGEANSGKSQDGGGGRVSCR